MSGCTFVTQKTICLQMKALEKIVDSDLRWFLHVFITSIQKLKIKGSIIESNS